jgi:hypothetical protein
LEIVDDREGKGSLLITSQIPNNRWHEIIGDPTLGDAILDRSRRSTQFRCVGKFGSLTLSLTLGRGHSILFNRSAKL